MRIAVVILGLVGLSLFIALIAYEGFGEIVSAVAAAGWGLLAVALYRVSTLLCDAAGWRCMLPPGERPGLATLMRLRWMTEAVNGLVPAAQIGGEIVRVRLIVLRGTSGAEAGASVIVDMTAGVASLMLFGLMGVAFLFATGDQDGEAVNMLIGLGVFSVLVAGFFLAQGAGMFSRMARVLDRVTGGREAFSVLAGAAALDKAVAAIYRRRADVAGGLVLRFLGWVFGVGEVWLALYFLGFPVTLAEAFFLESLVQAARAAAFAIPGALGVQEAAFMVLGGMIGLSAEQALALALVRRVREVVLGLPALVAWQVAEGHHWWRRGRRSP